MKFFSLIIATISAIMLIVGFLKGKKYEVYIENLDLTEHPLKEYYVVGYFFSNTKLLRLRGKLSQSLKREATILYGDVYYEYYAGLVWAQFLSFSILGICVASIFASFAGGFFLMIGLLAIAAIWNLTISKMKETLQKRSDDCVSEFPDMIAKLALLINSGMVLHDAWKLIAYGKDGELYDLMKKTCTFMDNGESDMTAIYKFGIISDSPEIKKFSSAIIQGLEKGNSGLADFLANQANELWEHKRQLVLQKGEVAAGKLIIPIALMFGGIILIIISAAMQSMAF